MSRREYPWDPMILERIAPIPEADASDDDRLKLCDRVVEAVESLEGRERRVLEALYWERKSYRAIGREWDCHPKNVWRVRKRALRKIKDALGDVFD